MHRFPLSLLLPLALLAAAPLAAQQEAGRFNRPDPEQRAIIQTERMNRALDLSPEQATQVLEINRRFIAERERINDELRQRRRAEHERTRDAQEAALAGVLTPEQMATLRAKLAERRERRPDRRPRRN